MSYYAEMSNGQVIRIDWLQYERLRMYGWVHRIMTEHQTVIHKIRRK